MKKYGRREVIKGIGGGIAAAVVAPLVGRAQARPSPAARRPNIVLILTDDQGYGDVGRHGHPFLKTPNLDRMYDESVRFTDFQVSPYCVPTRAAIMTGMNPAKSGITGCRWASGLTRGLTTIAEVLRQAGYATGIFGKWHLGDYEASRPDRRGFDETFIHGGGLLGSEYGDFPGNSYFDPVIYHNGTPEKTEGYCADVFFGRAAQWIESVKGEKPFFAYIATNTPHEPFIAPEEDARPYRDAVVKFPKDPRFFGQKLDPERMAHYFGMIANLDRNLGRFLARLKEWGIERDTLVVYMNDNGTIVGGGYWNAGMRGSKATVYTGGTRAISFWWWPGTLSAQDVDKLTAHVDLFPTFAALAGAKVPDDAARQLDGFSLLPLLGNPNAPWPDRMLFEHQATWRQGNAVRHKYSMCSVRYRKHHLVRHARPCLKDCPLCGTILALAWGGKAEGRKQDWELYDLATDPGERNDIAEQAPATVEELAAAYDRWWNEVLPYLGDDVPCFRHSRPLPFPALYWRYYRGPGPNNVPPPEGFLESLDASAAGES